MVHGMSFYLYTSKYPFDMLESPFSRPQQGEIQEDELFCRRAPDGKLFGTKWWWLRDVLMYRLADKYLLPQLKALAREQIFMQLDLKLEDMRGWPHLLEELYQTSRPDEKCFKERAIGIVAEMPRSTIEGDDGLIIMLSANPCYARNVIQYLKKNYRSIGTR
jgi:hypothetical protein